MKNTEIGHETNIDTKNNSLSVHYRAALFAWSCNHVESDKICTQNWY